MQRDRNAAATPVTVKVIGELDIATAPCLVRHLRPLLQAGRPAVLEVSELVFIDAAGLDCLLQLDTLAKRNGKRLRVAGHSPALRRLLDLTGLAGTFDQAHPSAAGSGPAVAVLQLGAPGGTTSPRSKPRACRSSAAIVPAAGAVTSRRKGATREPTGH